MADHVDCEPPRKRFPLARLLPGRRHSVQPAVRFASVSSSSVKTSKHQEVAEVSENSKVALKPASDVAAGAIARAASQSTIHPLDTLKVRMQAGGAKKAVAGLSKMGQLLPPPSAQEKVSNVIAKVGSLYKGVAGAASGAGIALGAYFAFYGVATNALVKHTDMPAPSVAFVAGGMAAAGSSVVKVPLAVCIRSVQANIYPNVFAAASSITSAAGIQGLFTGFLPTMLEDVPDMAFKFAAYETLRQVHFKMANRKANPTEDFALGAVSGAFAAAATTPLDVIKTNMMCNASSRPSMTSAARAVYSESGMKGFLRGIGPRSVSNGINSAVFFCFFEALRKVFAEQVGFHSSIALSAAATAPFLPPFSGLAELVRKVLLQFTLSFLRQTRLLLPYSPVFAKLVLPRRRS
mmetsp:Transcript_760/g.2286  ORF Transcript_760/g.2286 Transcript_760/m.2286 type:complete len:407 (+) Transcript_760:1173-2393(+)